MPRAMKVMGGFATPYPTMESAPFITCSSPGTFKTGQTLTCNNGMWNGLGLTYSYQWIRDASNIGGATSQTYLLAVADETHKISCKLTVTPTNPDYGGARTYTTPQTITITP